MRGVADFVVREDGIWEPWDAKLARKEAKVGHVLQLCFYADALGELLDQTPNRARLWLGSGNNETYDLGAVGPYWRRIRRQLSEYLATEDHTAQPEPCTYCQFCEFSEHCEQTWRQADSLIYVATTTTKERGLLEASDIPTLLALATTTTPVPGIPTERLARLHRQDHAIPPFEQAHLGQDPVFGHGYDELPAPDEADVYFDLEGDPFWRADAGLFFLFGLRLREELAGGELGEWTYLPYWAHNLDQQAVVAAEVTEFLADRFASYPEAHVYHYNHTERSSLAAMTLGGPAEATFSRLVSAGHFVDLMLIARNAYQVGVESYSLKQLERLTGFARRGGIEKGAGAVVDYEEYMHTGAQRHLERIARYNDDDVTATHALHRWLIEHRPPAQVWRHAVFDPHTNEDDAERDALAGELLTYPDESLEHLLGQLLGYWRRERSVDIATRFSALSSELHEMLDNEDVVTGLSLVEVVDAQTARGHVRKEAVWSFPPQALGPELRTPKKDQSIIFGEGGRSGEFAWGTLRTLDVEAGELRTNWPEGLADNAFVPQALTYDDWVAPKPKPARLAELASRVLNNGPSALPPAIRDLLLRTVPRLSPPHSRERYSDELADILDWVPGLENSCMAIQGPPGTGKTYRGAHVIHALITQGKRVGICAMSHAAVENLLEATLRVFAEHGDTELLNAVCKPRAVPEQKPPGVKYTTTNSVAAKPEFNLVCGTTWLFASKEFSQAPVDVLLIDEAGQLSLADAVAAAVGATVLMLLGDPAQLPQVSKATHPGESGKSVLEWLLDGHVTMPPAKGVFLAETRRMHPAVCSFISEQFYEDRLTTHPSCSTQGLERQPSAGLLWLNAAHQGCSTQSPEEAELIRTQIVDLLGTSWTDASDATRPLTPQDILVVAPYNDQVRLLRSVLEEDPHTSGVAVGTVDKFQGREAAVVFFTMTSSTPNDMPRGPEFLFSANRLNVAISRARCVAYLVATPALLDTRARTVEEMELIAHTSAFVEYAGRQAEASNT
jgi:uncharacterized protein